MREQPWFIHYPQGVPKELSLTDETLTAMFSKSAERFARRPALYFFGKTISYHECHALVERFACGLAALGIRKGDRVAMCLPNSPQAVIAYFGILRAGGIVVALMARHTTQPVQTFSVGFREAGPENELADAREVAAQFGAEHHELELSFADETVDLEELVWHLDEPLADLSALGFLALCEMAAKHVTVTLSGQGADELLGGYTKHRAASIGEPAHLVHDAGEPRDRAGAQVVPVAEPAREDHGVDAVQVALRVPQGDRLSAHRGDRAPGVPVVERPGEGDDPDPRTGHGRGPPESFIPRAPQRRGSGSPRSPGSKAAARRSAPPARARRARRRPRP